MIDLSFREGLENQVENKDLMYFMSDLMNSSLIQRVSIIRVNDVKYHEDSSNPKMINVEIDFSIWKKGESGYGTKYRFKNGRAKTFCCQNRSISKVI